MFTLAPAVVAPAPALVGRIEGTLLSRADGKPLVGVDVVVTGADGGMHRVTTDEAGGFAFDELAAGHYHVVPGRSAPISARPGWPARRDRPPS